MDLQRLKYFVEVARQKHFSRAAEVCRVSQPSLSQQIKKLETEVGGRLFQRSRGKITLTRLGQDFIKHAQAILADVDSAEEFINRLQEENLNTLRFGAIPTIAPYLLPDLLEAISITNPAARLEVVENTTSHLEEALLTGKIDFALWSPPTTIDAECDSVSIANDPLLLTLPPNHPLADSDQIDVNMILEERIILLENSHCLANQAGAFCDEFGLHKNIKIQSSQIETLLGLVEKGFGLTFTPAIAANAHRNSKVVFRSMEAHSCSREVHLVWLKRQYLTRSQQAVVDAAKALKPDVCTGTKQGLVPRG